MKNLRSEALYRLVAVAPVVCSVFAGFAVIGRQCRGWVELGYWPSIALHDVIDWWVGHPISSYRLAAGLLNLIGTSEIDDLTEKKMAVLAPVMRWILDVIPLALWLIVVLPVLWLLIWGPIFQLFGLPTRTR